MGGAEAQAAGARALGARRRGPTACPECYGRSTRKSYLSRSTGSSPGETPRSLT